jgi:hypothetical protein
MSASIRIESGIAAGTNYWIDRPVLRVGSDPQCEICLPTADLAPHALTLEFRGGTYRAYNRGTSPIRLDATTLQPGAAGVWDDGDMLMLPGDVRMVLAFDGDPRPCPRPETPMDDGFDDEQAAPTGAPAVAASSETASKAKSKSLLQMAVIGLCVLGTGALLLISRSGGFEAAPAPNRPTFNAIVVSSLTKGDNIRMLVQKLQFAQSFIVRGHDDYAKICFADLRDQLIRQMDSLPPADRKDAEVIRDYVEMQLGQLQ